MSEELVEEQPEFEVEFPSTETVECNGFCYKFPFGLSDFANEVNALAFRFKFSDASIEAFDRDARRWTPIEKPVDKKGRLEAIK